VWTSLKTRFVGADRVKTARLATLKGEFNKLYMEDREALDDYAGKISGMAARYAGLGVTLNDAVMVKKLLDTVPDRLFPAVAGIKQFCDIETMVFEEALGRLKATSVPGGALVLAANGATTSSFSRRPSGRLDKRKSCRSGSVSTAATAATSHGTAPSRGRRMHYSPMLKRRRRSCECRKQCRV
jgi:hypothetical protein